MRSEENHYILPHFLTSCYTEKVNLILFEPDEINTPLPRRDARTVHLLKVLHKKAGDSFEAGVLGINDAVGGNSGTGTIEHINADGSIGFSLKLTDPPAPRLPIRVAVGFPRPIQLRRLLRDLSSLGVEAIDLFGTELGEKSYRDTNLLNDGGARAALIEGAVQSRDTTLPTLSVYASLKHWLEKSPWQAPLPTLIAADNVRPEGDISRIQPAGSVVLAIGPERGWSDRERDIFEAAGFSRRSLGTRALRTETACVVAVALVTDKITALLR
ncbi:MAG: 16S rRNA (uracil(1498)-N(3))-methyltransferase [Treponema sp.]|nr:16S rRNA (uracil(1498)-N(3))-methyltransferase [Treponema sp.]